MLTKSVALEQGLLGDAYGQGRSLSIVVQIASTCGDFFSERGTQYPYLEQALWELMRAAATRFWGEYPFARLALNATKVR